VSKEGGTDECVQEDAMFPCHCTGMALLMNWDLAVHALATFNQQTYTGMQNLPEELPIA